MWQSIAVALLSVVILLWAAVIAIRKVRIIRSRNRFERNQERQRKSEQEAEAWAEDLFNKGDFRQLAATFWEGNYAYYRKQPADNALRKAGRVAVQALIEELQTHRRQGEWDVQHKAVDILIDLDDERAIPMLKELFAKNSRSQVYLDAVGCTRKFSEFIERHDADAKAQADKRRAMDELEMKRAKEAVWNFQESEIVAALVQLCDAYALEAGPDEIRRLERIATAIGERLHERGGLAEMRRLFHNIQNRKGARTLEMHWGGIGDWRG